MPLVTTTRSVAFLQHRQEQQQISPLRCASVEMTGLWWKGRQQQIPCGDDNKKGDSKRQARTSLPSNFLEPRACY
jgi:hypothetical protein